MPDRLTANRDTTNELVAWADGQYTDDDGRVLLTVTLYDCIPDEDEDEDE